MAKINLVSSSGILLSGERLHTMMNRCLVSGFESSALTSVAYEIRLSADPADIRMHDSCKGSVVDGVLTLHPGDAAILASEEILAMPLDLTGELGVKAGLAQIGILVLPGKVVHPGFGASIDRSGGERLSFTAVNIGHEARNLILGQTRLAHLQIFEIPSVSPPAKRPDFQPTGSSFSIFSHFVTTDVMAADIKDLESRLVALQVLAEQVRSETSARVDSAVESVVNQSDSAISQIEAGTKFVVAFGIYLVATTILGVALSVIINVSGSFSNLESWVRGLVVASVVLVAGASLFATIRILHLVSSGDFKFLMGRNQTSGQN